MTGETVAEFSKWDHVEFRCHATVRGVSGPFLVVIALDEPKGRHELAVPPTTIRLLSDPPELTLEERMELPIDDELVGGVESAIRQMVGPDGTLEEGLDEVALTAIDAVYNRGVVEKRVEHFKEGDRVEFKCKGSIVATAPASATVMLERIGYEMTAPIAALTNLDTREMTLEDAMEIDIDDGLLEAVQQAFNGMFGQEGQLIKPLREVALAATHAVYRYHHEYYSREASNPEAQLPE